MKKSVFIKIFAGYLAVTCLLAGCMFIFSFRIARHYYEETLTSDLEKLARTILVTADPLVASKSTRELDAFVKKLDPEISTRITVIAPDGKVLADSEKDPAAMENHKMRPEVIGALMGGVSSSVRRSATVGEDMLYVAIPIRHGSETSGVLRVSLFMNTVNHMLGDFKRGIIYAGLIIIACSLIISFILSRRLTNPIRKLSEASRRIASGDFDVRVFLKNNDELHDFADSFNFMTEKIRMLFSDISLQKEELNNIISSMHEGLVLLDRDGRIVLFNRRFQEIVPTDSPGGRLYWELIREPEFGELIKAVKSNRHNRIEEVPFDSAIHLCSASFIEQKEEILVVFLDITEVKNVERMKKDFILNVSHELRTPLTAIKGFVETMLDEAPGGTSRRYLDIVKRHTDRLINIVRDLMDLSRVEREQALELEPVSLKALIEQVRKIYEQRLSEKKLTLTAELHEGIPVFQADVIKLEQMFINLIDNAIKYTEQGGILISVKREDGHVIICVADTGIGIEHDHLPRIFERFYVVDKSRSRKAGGTGLGLSIVKHIVLLHNGSIDAESSPGKGTRFIVRLPLQF